MLKKLIRILWLFQPRWLRQFELAAMERFLAHPVGPQRQLLKGDAVVGGFFGTATGLGESARHLLRQLRGLGVTAHAANVSRFAVMEDFDAGPLWPTDAAPGGVAIFIVNPDMFNLVISAIGWRHLRQRRIIGLWFWELETIPRQWVRALRCVDEVWVGSHFIAQGLGKVAGNKPIHVLPPPLDVASIPTVPHVDPLPQFAGRVIVFFMYDVRSTHARKNPEAVIEAFRRAAADNPQALLVLKVNNVAVWPEADILLLRAIGDLSNVHLIYDKLPADGMKDLLARVDIVMSLHRSEGFGLLMAEGMAAGKPVIATGWSANLDFMTPKCSVLVAYKLIPAVDPQNIYNKYNALWADPDIDQAAAALKRLLADPAERQRMGAAARRHIAQFFSAEKSRAALPETFWQSLS